ncbi:TIGR04282 family arsenosugar biosynthesis glycosyltransferase [Lentisalinibacter salinarum]|uniref:TIGR04282 family arsenosugar biosynthesis glycosyltransferase n=1 Tax=Lentisalinibacter salinarum TaxID=2992239 RepID=UPI0038651D72
MVREQDALVLFCKPPERSKQRLVPVLGERRTAELAARLLECALEDLAGWPGSVVLSPAEPGDGDWAAGLGLERSCILFQRGGNLGERLDDIDLRLRDEGYRRRLYMGIDCPLLGVPALTAAANALDEADVVLGAAEDGGVVFMGTGPGWPPLAGLPWSTERLAQALAGACEAAGLRVRWLGRWPDVDRAADLGTLAAALGDDARPARQRLRDWLEDWLRPQEHGQRQDGQ